MLGDSQRTSRGSLGSWRAGTAPGEGFFSSRQRCWPPGSLQGAGEHPQGSTWTTSLQSTLRNKLFVPVQIPPHLALVPTRAVKAHVGDFTGWTVRLQQEASSGPLSESVSALMRCWDAQALEPCLSLQGAHRTFQGSTGGRWEGGAHIRYLFLNYL